MKKSSNRIGCVVAGKNATPAVHLTCAVILAVALISAGRTVAADLLTTPFPGPSNEPGATQTPAAVSTPTLLPDIGSIDANGLWQVHPGAPERQNQNPQSLPDGPPESKQWHAHLTCHGDRSVTGDISVEVTGQWLISNGSVRAQTKSGHLWGEIFDDDGNQAATFDAAMGASGAAGTFTTRDGEMGSMTWDGVLPSPPPGATWPAALPTPIPSSTVSPGMLPTFPPASMTWPAALPTPIPSVQ
jgi:hypothetical protein